MENKARRLENQRLMKIGEPAIQPQNVYQIKIEFMVGDADGTIYKTLSVPAEKYQEDATYAAEVDRLIKSLQQVIALDRQGRGGYTEMEDMIQDHYAEQPILDFLTYHGYDEDYNNIPNPNPTPYSELMFDIPSQEEWYTSFRGLQITYHNLTGFVFTVNVDK